MLFAPDADPQRVAGDVITKYRLLNCREIIYLRKMVERANSSGHHSSIGGAIQNLRPGREP